MPMLHAIIFHVQAAIGVLLQKYLSLHFLCELSFLIQSKIGIVPSLCHTLQLFSKEMYSLSMPKDQYQTFHKELSGKSLSTEKVSWYISVFT